MRLERWNVSLINSKEILDSERWVIATIALKGSGLIAEVKERNDVRLFETTKKNRDYRFKEISDFVSQTHQPDEGVQSSLVKWE
jgi:nucleoside-triphosphatase THEP1